MTTIQDVLDAISAAGAADCWPLADQIATEHGITACRMCFVASRLHPSVKQHNDIPDWFCSACLEKYLEQRRSVRVIKIYARPHGNDATGDGSLKNPYRTFARAQRDIPLNIPRDVRCEVDIGGITEDVDMIDVRPGSVRAASD